MSTHDLKLQQSTRQSGGERASVDRVVSNQDTVYTHTDIARSQDVSGHEKLHPGTFDQHIENKKESVYKTTATLPSRHITHLQKSSTDLQILLLRANKDSSKTSEDQRESARFTTVISVSLPSKRHKKDTAEDTDIDNTNETRRKTANQHHTEIKDRFSTTDTCRKLFLDGDGPKASFDEDSFSILQSQHGLTTSNQGQDTGIQHNIGLHEQSQIACNDTQRQSIQSIRVIQTEVSKGTNANKKSGASDCTENVPSTQNSNLTSLEKDSGLKSSTDCEISACHSEVLGQVLSLASFHTPLTGSTSEPEQSSLNPASTMLASALASVLAPPWSGRIRRSKQGGNEVEHEPQDCVQHANPSTSLRQEPRQHPFLASQRAQAERVLQEPNDNDMQFTARTSNNFTEWQKENSSPNITTTVPSKRAIMKSCSADTNRATMYNNAEPHHVPRHLDIGQVPKSPHSERRGYRVSKNDDQNEPFRSLSSKPTTSSLLLSLRRANLRKLNDETTQIQTQITRSVRSLTIPSRSILKNAQSCAVSVNSNNQGDTDSPLSTEVISETSHLPFSPRSRRRTTRTSIFLNKTETDTLKNPNTSVTRDEEQQFANYTTKSIPPEIPKPHQHSHLSILLRKYSSTEGGNLVEPIVANNTNQLNSNINNNLDIFSQFSPKDNGRNLKSQSMQSIPESNSMSTRTFTGSLKFSPRKESFSVDGINTTNGGQIYVDSKKSSQSSQSPMDLSSPLTPSRPTRGFHVPSIYSYLRESGPAAYTPNTSSTPSSHIQRAKSSFSMQSGDEILQGDGKNLPSRFSFDISPFEPPAQPLQKGTSHSVVGPAQSLPPDFGRKSAPRLSTSPYSTLISSRPALNSTLQRLSSPPAAKQLDKSASNDILTIRVYPMKDPSASPSMYKSVTKRPKEQLGSHYREQKTNTANKVQAYSCALDNHKPVQPCLLQTVPDASFVMESQSANITPHPRQKNTWSHEEHKDFMAVQLDKGNSYSKHRPSQKETSVTAENKTLLATEKETTDLQKHERLQEVPNSKKGLFALRVKKENVFASNASDSMADKDDVTPQYFKTKRNAPVLKTSSRIDQMLNRLKQTFSGKRSDNTLDTKNGNSATQKPLHTETFEMYKREEKMAPLLTNNEASSKSQSPSTLIKSQNTQSVDVRNIRIKHNKMHYGGQWEVPNSSLTTVKASSPPSESLSPLAFRTSEYTSNVDGQNRVKYERTRFGRQWESTNSSVTSDKASLPSLESLSPLTLRKSEKTLNVDGQNRVKYERTRFGRQWESTNSSVTSDKASLPSLESLSPLTLRKSEKTLNVDGQNRVKYRRTRFGRQCESTNSSVTSDKASLPSLESLSPLTLRKSEKTLNVDGQSRVVGEKSRFGSWWEGPNTLTANKASSSSLSPLTLRKSDNRLKSDMQKRWSDENGKQFYSSHKHRPKLQDMNRSATLPHYRNTSVGPPSPFNLFDYDSEDNQNDNVFYSPANKTSHSLCESDNFPQLCSTKSTGRQNLIGPRLSSSCADLKYGLNSGRSFSVSSVVSSRPSGPGRISTSSISDLSSLDDYMPKGHYPKFDSPISINYSPTYSAKSVTNNQSQPGRTEDQDKKKNSTCFWDEADPTPPPSPTFSPSSRRISQAASVSSPTRSTPDSPSPRGILPSRSYTNSLTVFEESSSDTTSDDEYYVDNGDGDDMETEL